MCSIDPIASLTEIKPEYQPKLFSIVFGESLIKDAVTIVLYKSVEQLVVVNGSTDSFSFEWYTAFIVLGFFVLIIVVSVLIGFVFALLLTLVFKYARFILKDNGVTEVGLIFLTGYISYLASELLGFSGVITMLFCGITLSHFNTYNMSAAGVQASKYIESNLGLHSKPYRSSRRDSCFWCWESCRGRWRVLPSKEAPSLVRQSYLLGCHLSRC